MPRAALNTGAGLWPSSIAVAGRTVRRFARTPQLIVFTTIQSVLFLLMFRFAFGGAIGTGGSLSYVSFLVPGFIATTVLWAGMGTATGVTEDVEYGFVDRLRSLPIPRAAVLIGRSLADTALIVWGLAIAAVFGFAVGFRLHGFVAGALAAFGLCVVFGFAFEWVFKPVSPMVNAVRGLATGTRGQALLEHSTSYYVGLSLIWAAGIFVVFGLLALWRFARR
jgi:ABC-type multidrug transport system permease subunit